MSEVSQNPEKKAETPAAPAKPAKAPVAPKPATTPKPAVAPKAPVKKEPVNIETDEDALKVFKKGYKLPEGDKIAYVAQDGNVFFKANEGSALNHAKTKGIKLFTVTP